MARIVSSRPRAWRKAMWRMIYMKDGDKNGVKNSIKNSVKDGKGFNSSIYIAARVYWVAEHESQCQQPRPSIDTTQLSWLLHKKSHSNMSA